MDIKTIRVFKKCPLLVFWTATIITLALHDQTYSSNNKDVVISTTAANISQGEKLYVRCSGCHSLNYHRTGPKHCGVFGKLAGSDSNFSFTDEMEGSGITWNANTLDDFLANPSKTIPGTSMGFSGIKSAKERKQLIAFLKSLSPENEKCK